MRLCGSASRALRGRVGDDEGSAVVEFVTLAVLLLVPVVYLVISLGRIQAGAFAVEGASRDAAQLLASAPDDQTAARRIDAAVSMALRDQGLDRPGDPAPQITVTCSAQPCLTPESAVSVAVEVEIRLPGVPAFFDALVPARVPVRADGHAVVERFGGVP